MFRKLTSLLFQEEEEEIIISNESEEESDFEIPIIKPMIASEPVAETVTKKTVMLNADEQEPQAEKKTVAAKLKSDRFITADKPYKPTEILSPIYGSRQTTDPVSFPKTEVKKHASMTELISPMHGRLEIVERDITFSQELLELNVEDMINAQQETETQATLFDYLEGFNND